MFGDDSVIFKLWRSPRAISLTLFWSIYPLHLIATYARNVNLDKSLPEILAQAFIAPLVGIVPLYIARYKILKNRPASSVRLTLLTYFTMAVLDGTTSRLFALGSEVQYSEILAGIGINIEFIAIFFSLGTYVLVTLESLSKSLRAKSVLLSKIIAKRDASRNKAEQEILALQEILQSRVTPILESVELGIRNLNIEYARQDGGRLAQKIQIESITPIRQTSHDLAKNSLTERSPLSALFARQVSQIRTFLFFAKTALTTLRPPNYLASAIFFVFIVSVVRGDCRPRTFLMNSILAAILIIASTLGRSQYFKKSPRGAYLTIGSLVIATTIWIRIYNSPVLECVDSRPGSEVIFASIAIGLSILVSGFYSQFVVETNVEQRRLDEDIAIVRSDISRLENQVSQMRRKSALVLHGPVLGRLSSIALTLKEFSDREVSQALEELDDMKSRLLPLIESSQAELAKILTAEDEVNRPIRTKIDEVVQYWQGLISVEYTIDPVLEKLIIDQTPQLSIADLIQELITNANRHANARRVIVEVSLAGASALPSQLRINIKCQDDGVKRAKIKSKGLGLSPIIEAGGEWSLTPITPRGNIIDISYPYFADYSA